MTGTADFRATLDYALPARLDGYRWLRG
jgi:hypothetical protein